MPRRVRDTKQVTLTRTLLMGACAALCVSLYSYLVRSFFAASFQAERWIGDVFIGRADDFGWNFGFSALIFEGAAIALVYRSLFRSAHRSGLLVGLHLSVFHAVITGILLTLTRYGFFAFELGLQNAVLIFCAHFIYGSTLGLLFDLAATRREYPQGLSSTENHR